MYNFKQVNNTVQYLPKDLILSEFWQSLPKATRVILPVLHYSKNKDTNTAFQQQQTTAILSGMARRSIVNAYKALADIPIIKQIHRENKKVGGFIYKVEFKPQEECRTFSFANNIIEGGVWSVLSPKAKLLFLSIKAHSFFDFQMYYDSESLIGSDDNIDLAKEDFTKRKYDFCVKSKKELSNTATIHPNYFGASFNELEDNHLVKYVDHPEYDKKYMIVNHNSCTVYTLESLNKSVSLRYKKVKPHPLGQ